MKLKTLLILIAFSSFGYAGDVVKSYPTSPITTLYLDAYIDGIAINYRSTSTFKVGEWSVLGSTWTKVTSTTPIKADVWVWDGSTWSAVGMEFSLQDYTNAIVQKVRFDGFNEILDQRIEQFLVYPGTSAPAGWKGWCLNSKGVAVPCL